MKTNRLRTIAGALTVAALALGGTVLGASAANVATAAPGDPGYRGGRWQVLPVSLPDGYGAALASGDLDDDGVLDSVDELIAAQSAGDLAVGAPVASFECPVIKVPANG